jgi:hypothetical protein
MSNSPDPYTYGPYAPQPGKTLFWGMAAAIAILTLLLIKNCNQPLPAKPDIVPIATIKAKVTKADTTMQQQARKWQYRADSAITAAADLKATLRAEQANGRALSERLLAVSRNYRPAVKPPKSGELDGATTGAVQVDDYTVEPEADITALVESGQRRDSLCNSAVALLETAVAGKDSVIAAKDAFAAQMRAAVATGLDNQAKLETYAGQLRKASRRARFCGRVWKVATVVLAGILINEKLK